MTGMHLTRRDLPHVAISFLCFAVCYITSNNDTTGLMLHVTNWLYSVKGCRFMIMKVLRGLEVFTELAVWNLTLFLPNS